MQIESQSIPTTKGNVTASPVKIKTTFGELAIGENFYRRDGFSGASLDKISATHAKPCSTSGTCSAVEFAGTDKVMTFRRPVKFDLTPLNDLLADAKMKLARITNTGRVASRIKAERKARGIRRSH